MNKCTTYCLLFIYLSSSLLNSFLSSYFNIFALSSSVLPSLYISNHLILVGKGWLGGVKAKGGVNMAEMSIVLHDAKVNKHTVNNNNKSLGYGYIKTYDFVSVSS